MVIYLRASCEGGLWVNADARRGQVVVDLLDREGNVTGSAELDGDHRRTGAVGRGGFLRSRGLAGSAPLLAAERISVFLLDRIELHNCRLRGRCPSS